MTLNDKIVSWLKTNSIAFGPGDFLVGHDSGEPDKILSWNDGKLGAQPSQEQLDSIPVRDDELIEIARGLLAQSDVVMLRCVENSIQVPPEWASYRSQLRAIARDGFGTIPDRPQYPAGS